MSEPKRTSALLDTLSMIGGLLSVFMLALGLHDIDNYIHWLAFPCILMAAGVILGWRIYHLIKLFIFDLGSYRNSKNMSPLTLLVISFAFISFGAGAFLNEYSYREKTCNNYVIEEMGESAGRTKSYFVFIQNGTQNERLSFGEKFNQQHHPGDTLNLCIIRGWLGFRYYKINSGK